MHLVLPAALAFTVVLTPTAALVCQEQGAVDPIADLAHSDFRKRNAAARRLKNEVDAHVDALAGILLGEEVVPAGMTRSGRPRFSGRRARGTPRGLDRAIAELLPKSFDLTEHPRRSLGLPGTAQDRLLILPWGTRNLAAWLLGHAGSNAARERATTALETWLRRQRGEDAEEAQDETQDVLDSLARLAVVADDDQPLHRLCASSAHGVSKSQIRRALRRAGAAGQTRMLRVLTTTEGLLLEIALLELDEAFLRSQVREEPAIMSSLTGLFLGEDRTAAALAGGLLEHLRADAAPMIAKALATDDEADRGRLAGLLALMREHTAGAIDDILARLDDGPLRERQWLIDSLGNPNLTKTAARSVTTRLLRAIGESEGEARQTVLGAGIRAIGRMRSKPPLAALDTIRAAASDRMPRHMRLLALRALDAVGCLDHLSVHDMTPVVWGENDALKPLALKVLAVHGDRGVPVLERALTKKSFLRTEPREFDVVSACDSLDAAGRAAVRPWLHYDLPWARVAALHAWAGEPHDAAWVEAATAVLRGPAPARSSLPDPRISLRDLLHWNAKESAVVRTILHAEFARGEDWCIGTMSSLPDCRDAVLPRMLELLSAPRRRGGWRLGWTPPDREFLHETLLPALGGGSKDAKRSLIDILYTWGLVDPLATDWLLETAAETLPPRQQEGWNVSDFDAVWRAIGQIAVADEAVLRRIEATLVEADTHIDCERTAAILAIIRRLPGSTR